MSTEEEIGELLVKDGGITVEWKIKNVLSYTKEDEFCCSPTFSVPGSDWCLRIYPNGRTEDKSVGWITVYLFRRDSSSQPKAVNFSIAVKKTDGATDKTFEAIKKCDGSNLFKNNRTGRGFDFLQRSELRSRMSELAPSGDLTVTCNLKVNDTVECTSRLNKLSQNLKDMFTSERGCDVTLEVKDGNFSVHSSILTARSPVLAAMFEVDMKEKNTGSVDIVDFNPETLLDFLKYLYSAEFENLSNDIFELYRIAHKYDVEGLKSDCIHSLMNSLSLENFFEAVILGHQFNEAKLINKTQEFFNESSSKIISSDEWDSFLESNVTIGNRLVKNMAARRLKTESHEIKIQ